MGEAYPQIERLRQLRKTLSKLRLNSIVLGADGRNRALLGQFVASTGRNAHKASEFIFGPSRWLRGLIKPTHGSVLVYLDWSAQEFVIAAALSGDQHMLAAIASGDPYMWFAKMARLVPEWATDQTHDDIREICKRCCLGVLYGMGARALALRIKRSEFEARELLDHHRRLFPTFWAWSNRAVRTATWDGFIDLAFGWRVHHGTDAEGQDTGPPTLMNAPMQGNGAEMLRLAAIFGHRAGVTINAPLHDAFMIEATARGCARRHPDHARLHGPGLTPRARGRRGGGQGEGGGVARPVHGWPPGGPGHVARRDGPSGGDRAGGERGAHGW